MVTPKRISMFLMLWMRERRLAGLVAGAVEADHQAVAHELVVAHALHRGEVLHALGVRGRGGQQEQRGAERGEQMRANRIATHGVLSPLRKACAVN